MRDDQTRKPISLTHIRSAETLKLLEDLVLDLVTQLYNTMPAVDDPRGNNCAAKRLIVQLADRRKPVKPDGYESMLN